MRLPPSRGGRDFFPLPRVAVQVNEECGCWRRRDRSARRTRASTRRINDLVDSLNWMQGFKDSEGYGRVLYPLEKNIGSLLVDPMRYEVLARLDGPAEFFRVVNYAAARHLAHVPLALPDLTEVLAEVARTGT